jgi:hypothetical protein
MKTNLFFCFLFAELCLSGCSVLQKNSYWKPVSGDEGWEFVNGHLAAPYYSSNNHKPSRTTVPYYVYCDSSVMISLAFHQVSRCSAWGPPLLPLIPGRDVFFPDLDGLFTYELTILTKDSIDIKALARHLHFYANDSAEEILPIDSATALASGGWLWAFQWRKKRYPGTCGVLNSNFYNATLRQMIRVQATSVKSITLGFDREFNDLLHLHFKNILFKKPSRLHYDPFELPAH